MRGIRKKEIRIKADDFREKCKVSRFGILDLFKDCECLGYKVFRYPLRESAVLGFAIKRDEDIILFSNTSSRLSREIFTLAHEVGHVLLHLDETSSYVDDSLSISERSTDEREQEANYFAACLLMPSNEVDRFLETMLAEHLNNELSAMDIARMMSEFNVSFDMTLNRLENLGKIDSREHLRLDNAKYEQRVGQLLQSVGGNARLNLPSNVMNFPAEYIDYAIYNYNHNAIPLETLKRVLDCYELDIEEVSDRLVKHEGDDNDDLDDLIGGLED